MRKFLIAVTACVAMLYGDNAFGDCYENQAIIVEQRQKIVVEQVREQPAVRVERIEVREIRRQPVVQRIEVRQIRQRVTIRSH